MAGGKLDRLDLKILDHLQDDGRITNVELANRIGISPPPCLRRVRALEKRGLIKGYHAEVNQEALGYDVTAFAMVGLASQAESDLAAFEAKVASWPLVRECYMLSGEIDYMLKVVAHDVTEFQKFITDELTSAENVASVKTSLTIRRSKQAAGVPVHAALDGRQDDDA